MTLPQTLGWRVRLDATGTQKSDVITAYSLVHPPGCSTDHPLIVALHIVSHLNTYLDIYGPFRCVLAVRTSIELVSEELVFDLKVCAGQALRPCEPT
jgi:hypothetical protein